jgi:D-sedoheptulose 7-phosphate isomerase
MEYFKSLSMLFNKIRATGTHARRLTLPRAFSKTVRQLRGLRERKNRVFLIGNGGSAAIANHLATDLLKNGGLRAFTFNETSLITCVSNDFGYESVFAKPLEIAMGKGDMLIAISSSGQSRNIIEAALVAKKKGCCVVTLTGFDAKNHLRTLGDTNFYVPSLSYGFVETVHAAICHCLADLLIRAHAKRPL